VGSKKRIRLNDHDGIDFYKSNRCKYVVLWLMKWNKTCGWKCSMSIYNFC